jgi:hypothetical protein
MVEKQSWGCAGMGEKVKEGSRGLAGAGGMGGGRDPRDGDMVFEYEM